MHIIFRTDSSQEIGSGHVMRCLTLAEELHRKGAKIEFIVRNHKGNINEHIKNKGFEIQLLPSIAETKLQQGLIGYEKWLGIKQEIDADETIQILKNRQASWLIIDHYALDCNWEERARVYAEKIMVIDDLADRKHDCDLLLDQNYIHNQRRYDNLVSTGVTKLLGPKYALIRRGFIENRKNRVHSIGSLKNVFIFFGGADLDNLTLAAIKAS
jgi:UDP-2,4-diacetamido-2,4,6-trideoxy-beta-L-altropyranose hydrolase